MYSLTDGLTALGAYGITIIANNILYDSIKIKLSVDNSLSVVAAYVYFIPVLGIAYVAGFLGYIILNSEFIIVGNLKFFITFGLVITIVITHIRLISDINSYFIKEKGLTNRFTAYVCSFWGGIFTSFMLSPDITEANLMLLIQFLPIVSKHVVPRLSSIKYKASVE